MDLVNIVCNRYLPSNIKDNMGAAIDSHIRVLISVKNTSSISTIILSVSIQLILEVKYGHFNATINSIYRRVIYEHGKMDGRLGVGRQKKEDKTLPSGIPADQR